jgi:hypothetical protein
MRCFPSLLLTCFCLFIHVAAAEAQRPAGSVALKTNDAELHRLHEQLVSGAADDESRLRSFYTWIAGNIIYDVAEWKKESPDPVRQSPQTVIRQKKAVCHGYAELFRYLCIHSGIPCYLVSGYTMVDRAFTNEGHTWNVVNVNGSWKQVDVTWGAGAVENGTYIQDFSLRYFLADKDTFLTEHYPFDPMWQLQESPVALAAFRQGKTGNLRTTSDRRFAFADTIALWIQEDSVEQQLSSAARMMRFAPDDPMSRYHMDFALISAGNRAMDRQLKWMQEIPVNQELAPNTYSQILSVLDSAAFYGRSAESFYRKASPSDKSLAAALLNNKKSLAYNMGVIERFRKSVETAK